MRYYRLFVFIILGLLLQNNYAFAADNVEIDGLIYEYVRFNGPIPGYGEVYVAGYSSNIPENLKIPSTVKYEYRLTKRQCTVTTISSGAFLNCSKLKSINTAGVDYIMDYAFQNCTSLKKVSFGGGCKSIGSGAFTGCVALDTIDYVSGVSIADDAFDENTYQHAKLIVDDKYRDECESHEVYSKFQHKIYRHSISVGVSYGSVSYNGAIVKSGDPKIFEELDGSSVTLTFSPEQGRELANLIIDGEDVTSKVINNQYRIDNVSKSMNIQVSFFSITISSKGNGHILCKRASVYNPDEVQFEYGDTRNETVSYIVPATDYYLYFYIYPDDGHQLTKVIKDGIDITPNINVDYPILSYNINYSSTLEFTFEEIPPVTHTLSIKSVGNGSVSFDEISVREDEKSFSIVEGLSPVLLFTPDAGHRIKSVKVNGKDVTSSLSNDKYTINNINADTSIEVLFEPILHTLTIVSSGFGDASYNGVSIHDKTQTFSVVEGTSPTITFTPETGCRIASVKLDGTDVIASVVNNTYTIRSISADMTLSVTFEAIPTYTLSVTSSGNGSAYFNNTTIRNKTEVFTVNGDTDATITFTPDAGYRIASVKVNGTDVTSSVINNQYTISKISANATIAVTYEAIAHTLSITSLGNGKATYNYTDIRNNTETFTVNEGTSATVAFAPDAGYRISNVKLNNTDVTVSIVNNSYTISNITANTTLSVTFEVIPPTTYAFTISAVGNGTVTYDGNTVKGKTSSFTVVEGTNAVVTFSADEGYRLKSVKLDNADVTSFVVNNQYTINNIKANTSLEVTFEAIPTYSLNITASGNGSVTYNGTAVRGKTQTFTVNEGTSATIAFTPDAGYKIKSVKLNATDVTASVVNNKYTISNIKSDNTLEVEFEAITHTLTIKAMGNGSATFNSTAVKGKSQAFTVNEGTSATITFTPDAGYRIKSVKLNATDVTASVANNQYMISNIKSDNTLEVEFEAITHTLTIKATGNGSATFNSTAVKGKSEEFTVNEGASATVTFIPDANYKIKSIKLNATDITSSVKDYQYTISNINSDNTLEVEFEAIIHTLNIVAVGNGNVDYNGIVIRNQSQSYSVQEGSSVVLSFAPDAGYRVGSVKVNNTDVTASVTNNSYTISNITANTTLEVTFEAIPPTTYAFTLSAVGNGTVTYDGNTVRGKTSSFTVVEGTNVKVTFSADEGYRLKSVKLDNTDVTSSVVNNQYMISNIKANTSLEVTFESIPTYSLNITASGNGSATYDGTAVRGKTQVFTVREGTTATITFAPDAGYRIASVKLNNTDVTASVANNSYTISNITANTTLSVTFEAIPPTTYAFTISAVGNGYVAFDGNTIRSKTFSFNVVSGTNAVLTFSADEGNRLKSVKVNGQDVTSSIVGNQYTITNISANTTIAVVFEAIPTYALNIVASGNGSASYDGVLIRNQSQNFTLREGAYAVISFSADNGYRIASVKVNNADVTSQIVDGKITINNITQNTNVEVVFEEIPPIVYALSITATGNGSVTYDGNTVKGKTSTFTIIEGSYVNVQLSADDGYRLKSITLNGQDVTADVANNQYTTPKMMADAALVVVFEAIPTFALTVKSSAFGSVKFGDAVVANRTETFSVREGTSATMTFTPDDNGRLHSITLNGTDITKELVNGQYTISNIRSDQSVEAEFVEDITKVTDAGIAYTVTSYDEQTVVVAAGNYGNVLTVPASFTAKEKTWTVVGIDEDALKDNTTLAAIVWNPEVAFTAKVSNPNLLLYVKDAQYAPATIQNVVVNNQAENIVLVEAASGNDFYCPQAFTAKRISYEHNYSMISGYKTCQGWETLVLPFDVTMMINAKGQELTPYINWQYGNSQHPFWLYEMTTQGWKAGSAIKANTPYIISMPNNEMYDVSFNQTGNIQFIGTNVEVKASTDMTTGQHGNKRLVANYQTQEASADIYALNVSNEWSQNTATEAEGSTFIRSLRSVHPFEAYLTVEGSNAPLAIPLFENMPTGINEKLIVNSEKFATATDWYTIDGRKLQGEPKQNGIYIIKGKKVKR